MGKKKVLLIGPIGNYGGREIEVAFIAKSLRKEYHVLICSTGFISSKSQVRDFISPEFITSFNNYLYNTYPLIRLSSYFSYLKNGKKEKAPFYSKNVINKKIFKAENKLNRFILNLVSGCDLIFISAQISSSYLPEIVSVAKRMEKPVIFRCTGNILSVNEEKQKWLNQIYIFLYNSENIAFKLSFIQNYNYKIIDQCAFHEKNLLKLDILRERANSFLIYSRLIKEKNIDIVLRAFLKAKRQSDRLFIVGDGPEMENLKLIANQNPSIFFYGFVPNQDMFNIFSKVDCVLIPYHEQETGPITGIESMAAGRIIISATSGAMPDRLPSWRFWHDNSLDDLVNQIKSVQNLSNEEVSFLSQILRKRYLSFYNSKKIAQDYLMVVDNCIKSNQG